MEFRVLGAVEAWSGGVRVDVGARQQRLVLAVLALEANRVVSVDRLIDLVWAQAPPTSARGTVQALVSRLRAALRAAGGAAEIVSRGTGYLLRVEPLAVDAHHFAALTGQARDADDETAVGLLHRAWSPPNRPQRWSWPGSAATFRSPCGSRRPTSRPPRSRRSPGWPANSPRVTRWPGSPSTGPRRAGSPWPSLCRTGRCRTSSGGCSASSGWSPGRASPPRRRARSPSCRRRWRTGSSSRWPRRTWWSGTPAAATGMRASAPPFRAGVKARAGRAAKA
ncbi:winged helix-turn-helix domain-containing protein [Micromonospora sp. NPDC047548]|uniref:AfsR/SARP family transcriptional regulator n=1 Tax=Micromonospora sp. NPDC047548 TaxID=3155624 RepID=UPI0033E29445